MCQTAELLICKNSCNDLRLVSQIIQLLRNQSQYAIALTQHKTPTFSLTYHELFVDQMPLWFFSRDNAKNVLTTVQHFLYIVMEHFFSIGSVLHIQFIFLIREHKICHKTNCVPLFTYQFFLDHYSDFKIIFLFHLFETVSVSLHVHPFIFRWLKLHL